MTQLIEIDIASVKTAAQEVYLAFSNPGVLEIDSIRLMGVSVKETANPIGFFGTGLKYAMAATLRMGGAMTIITDGECYEVLGRPTTVRGKHFTQVMLNDEPLGFTTDLGKHWEPWMALRELYSNAMDEGGKVELVELVPDQDSLNGTTAIILQGDCFVSTWKDRCKFLIGDNESLVHVSDFTAAHQTHGANRAAFYRGIKVFESIYPTRHRYNLLEQVVLTEDRTLRHEWQFQEAIEKSIITSTDTKFIESCLTTGTDYYEYYLPFNDAHSSITESDEFRNTCRRLDEQKPRGLNKSAIAWYRSRTLSSQPVTPAKLTRVQQAQLDKAATFVRAIGFGSDFDNFEVIVANWLGEGVYGRAEKGTIYISKECFDKGTKFLASTLLEEYVHCRYGFADHSRDLQTWLFDRIITMGEEHVTGEPL